MNVLSRPVAVLTGIGLICATWVAMEAWLLSPKRTVDAEIVELRAEIASLVDRGSAALDELRLTQSPPPKQETAAIASLASDLHQIVRDAVVSSGGELVSSQSSEDGSQVLVRARLSETSLLGFARSIEVAPGRNYFVSLDVQPVPVPGMGTILEATVMVQNAD